MKKDISIKNTLQEFKEGKYDKKDFSLFCLLIFFLYLLYDITTLDPENYKLIGVGFLVFLIISIVYFGYYTLFANNEIYKKECPFPAFSNFKQIVRVGSLTTLGHFIYILLLSFILLPIMLIGTILFFIISKANITTEPPTSYLIFCVLTLSVILYGVYYTLILPLFIRYSITLSFEDIFSLKKGLRFIKTRKKEYWAFVVRNFVFSIAVLIPSVTLVVYFNYFYTSTHILGMSKEAFVCHVSTIWGILNAIIYIIIFPSLQAKVVGDYKNLELENEKSNIETSQEDEIDDSWDE